MYTFLLMAADFFKTGQMHWYVLFMLFILIRWVVVRVFAVRYKPWTNENKGLFTTVIIPVVDEPIDLFTRVINRILDQQPSEIIIAINGPDNPGLLQACRELRHSSKDAELHAKTTIKVLDTRVPSKRNAIKLGVRSSDPRSDITVLVDSDSIWTEGTLENLLRPFSADDKIGGVTTRQKIYRHGRTLATMIAGLLEEIRAEGTMKAMSVTGKVGCLPGRTIAFRTSILRRVMNDFMTETFMGIHKEVSDDRSLTNLTLKLGYKTVLQDTSVVYTDAPERFKKFLRQQLRWAEGSQYNNIRMTLWMFKNAKLMCFIYWSDMILPFLLISTYTNMILCFIFRMLGYSIRTIAYTEPIGLVLTLILVGAAFGLGSRNWKALLRLPPWYLLLLPVLTLVLSFVMAPLRIYGLMCCADGLGWGTRVLTAEEAESETVTEGGAP